MRSASEPVNRKFSDIARFYATVSLHRIRRAGGVMAEFEKDGPEVKSVFWTVLHCNVVKFKITKNSDRYRVGEEADCIQLVLGSSAGEHLTLMLEPGEGGKLMQTLIIR